MSSIDVNILEPLLADHLRRFQAGDHGEGSKTDRKPSHPEAEAAGKTTACGLWWVSIPATDTRSAS